MFFADRPTVRAWSIFLCLGLIAFAGAAAGRAVAQTPLPFVVRDLYVIPAVYSSYSPGPAIECSGRAYFAATSSVNGRELWSTDGTPVGTRLVRDIFPGNGSADPKDFIVYTGKLYFTADDGTHGREAWVTDGSPTGTRMLADFRTGALPSNPTDFRVVQNKLVFSAWSDFYVYDGSSLTGLDFYGACCLPSGACVFVSDVECNAQTGMWGGSEVTCQAVSCNQPVSVSCCLPDKSCVYRASSACVSSGGTPNPPNTLCGTCPGPATIVCCLPGGSCTMVTQQECATAGGSQRFFTTSCSPEPCAVTPSVCCLGSQQCFVVSVATECTSRGGVVQAATRVCSAPGTTQSYCSSSVTFPCCRPTGVCSVVSGPVCLNTHKGWLRPSGDTCSPICFQPATGNTANVSRVFGAGSRVVMFGRPSGGIEVWGADDLAGPRQLLVAIPSTLAPSSATNPMVCGGRVYFSVGNYPNCVFWTTDGTVSGTYQVPGMGANRWGGNCFAGENGVLYFEVLDANGTVQVWRTDASLQGTYSITTFPFGSGSVRDVVYLNGAVLFNRTYGPTDGRQLWRVSDPPLPDEPVAISPPQLRLAESTSLTKHDGEVYLCAVVREGMWKTDGTASGTIPVPGSAGGATGNLTTALGRVFFTLGGYSGVPSTGGTLWTTDGTASGTSAVVQIDGGNSSDLGQMCAASGDNLFFEAPGDGTGRELFITDGTQVGTRLIKDLFPGTTGSIPQNMVYANGALMFSATLPGPQPSSSVVPGLLCRSDGTLEGTGVIGSTDPIGTAGSRAVEFTAYAGRLYYFDRSPESGYELWSTDGSPDGASIFFEAVPGPADGCTSWDSIKATALHGGFLYFRARTGLYRTDGTVAGTVCLYPTDPTSNTPIGSLYPTNLGMYFLAAGRLWMTDGTLTGTQPLVPGNVPPYGGSDLVETNGRLYFIATTAGGPSYGLWISDGTTNGTTLVTPLALGASNGTPSVSMVGYAGKAYFLVSGTPFPNAGTGPILTVSDGTAAGTQTVFNPVTFPYWVKDMKTFGDKLLFVATVPNSENSELWTYDGVAPPVKLTTDLNPSAIRDLTIAGDSMYFLRYSSSSFAGLYRTDGTPQGTVRVTPHDVFLINSQLGFSGLGAFGNNVVLGGIATGAKACLYRTNAPASGIQLVKELDYTGGLKSFTQVGSQLFFKSGTFHTGEQVFVTDGTPEGTRPATQVNNQLSFLQDTTVVGVGNGFHICSDSRLYFSDGTTEGTRKVIAFNALNSSALDASGLACVNDTLYFVGDTITTGIELWQSDGTSTGTSLLADLTPGAEDSAINRITQGVNRFFFSTSIRTQSGAGIGQEPCVSDGTPQGTRLIVDLRPGTSGSSPQQFVDAGTFAVFTADAGTGTGRELYRTDGTAVGTFLLKDILPGSVTSNPQGMVVVGALIYFTADDGVHGRELWRTDGTAAGTVLVRDLCPGAIGSNPQWLTAIDDRVYFTAYTPETGIELWTSNGTAAGTIRMFEVVPGPSSANIRNLTVAGERLYFLATVPPQEASLWSFDWVGGRVLLCVADYNRSTSVTVDDLFLYLHGYFAGDPAADVDGSDTVTIDDLFTYINLWFRGC